MKITTWVRLAPDGRTLTLRSDYKFEGGDSPVVQRYGLRLHAALEGCGEQPIKQSNNQTIKQ